MFYKTFFFRYESLASKKDCLSSAQLLKYVIGMLYSHIPTDYPLSSQLIDRISRLTAIRLAIGGQALGVAVIALMATAVQLKGDILECVPVELYTVFAVLVSVLNIRVVRQRKI